MNALEEINGMVKKAWGLNLGSIFRDKPITNPTLKRMAAKPIDYSRPDWKKQIQSWKADESKNRDEYAKQEADWEKNVLSRYAKATGSSMAQANSAFNSYRSLPAQLPSMNGPASPRSPKMTAIAHRPAVASAKPSASADPKIMPNGLRINGSGWTGRQVVQGGSAPVSRVQRSELKPYNALHSFKSPSQLAQLPSMQMMRNMNDPKWNTPERRLANARLYMTRQSVLASRKQVASANDNQSSQQIAQQRPSWTAMSGRRSGSRMRALPTGSLGGWSRKL